jgi:hypothetical protein
LRDFPLKTLFQLYSNPPLSSEAEHRERPLHTGQRALSLCLPSIAHTQSRAILASTYSASLGGNEFDCTIIENPHAVARERESERVNGAEKEK